MTEGWEKAGGGPVTQLDLVKGLENTLAGIAQAEAILIVFPLYTDFVPGLLKEVFDGLSLLPKKTLAGKRLACVVHSGFPESAQSEGVAAWLTRSANRLGLDYAGCLIKGGSEGFHIMPPQMTARMAELFRQAGMGLARAGSFPEKVQASLASPRTLGPGRRMVFRVMRLCGLSNFYWNSQLRSHGAFEKRFDSPYGPPA